MANVNIAAEQISPIGGVNNAGYRLGYVDSGAKAAQNDTWTITNADQVLLAWPTVDATGASGTYTVSGNIITLTSATTGAHSALILYR